MRIELQYDFQLKNSRRFSHFATFTHTLILWLYYVGTFSIPQRPYGLPHAFLAVFFVFGLKSGAAIVCWEEEGITPSSCCPSSALSEKGRGEGEEEEEGIGSFTVTDSVDIVSFDDAISKTVAVNGC